MGGLIEISGKTIGETWLKTASAIIKKGRKMWDEEKEIKELVCLLLIIEHPSPEDKIIKQFGDPKWLRWMESNFFEEKEVPELGNAKSYAFRLFNYGGQKINQIERVTEKLANKPESKSATITTLMPHLDTSYIPCVSLLDFYIRDDYLKLNVYARSLDFGKKAYGNLVTLSKIQKLVAKKLHVKMGEMILFVKSAHIYKEEFKLMERIIKEFYEGLER